MEGAGNGSQKQGSQGILTCVQGHPVWHEAHLRGHAASSCDYGSPGDHKDTLVDGTLLREQNPSSTRLTCGSSLPCSASKVPPRAGRSFARQSSGNPKSSQPLRCEGVSQHTSPSQDRQRRRFGVTETQPRGLPAAPRRRAREARGRSAGRSGGATAAHPLARRQGVGRPRCRRGTLRTQCR